MIIVFTGLLASFFFILIVWVIRKKRPSPAACSVTLKNANFYFFCLNIYAHSGCIVVSPPLAPVAWIKTTSQQVYCLNRFRHAGQHLNLKSAKTSLEILYSTLIFLSSLLLVGIKRAASFCKLQPACVGPFNRGEASKSKHVLPQHKGLFVACVLLPVGP